MVILSLLAVWFQLDEYQQLANRSLVSSQDSNVYLMVRHLLRGKGLLGGFTVCQLLAENGHAIIVIWVVPIGLVLAASGQAMGVLTDLVVWPLLRRCWGHLCCVSVDVGVWSTCHCYLFGCSWKSTDSWQRSHGNHCGRTSPCLNLTGSMRRGRTNRRASSTVYTPKNMARYSSYR